MSKRANALYLQDIKNALNKIKRYMAKLDFLDFTEDQKTIDAVIRNLEIIGEAASHLPIAFKNEHSNIPWGKMIGLRNKVIHEYFGVDLEILWETIVDDLPPLVKKIAAIK